MVFLRLRIPISGGKIMGQQEEKSGVQKLRERFYSIKNNLKPSKELIDALIKSGK
jgi:hypothetical protein